MHDKRSHDLFWKESFPKASTKDKSVKLHVVKQFAMHHAADQSRDANRARDRLISCLCLLTSYHRVVVDCCAAPLAAEMIILRCLP